MVDKIDNYSLNISFKESDWMSSTPTSLCHYETKFYTAFDETFESEYNSATSNIFANYENSLSAIGTKGSSNVFDSELSLPTSFADDEIDKEYEDSRKNIDFDEHNVARRKDISLNVKNFGENGVYKKSLAREKRLPDGRPTFQNFKFEENSLSEQTNEKNMYHTSLDRQIIDTLVEECTLNDEGRKEEHSNKILTSNPTDLRRFQRSPMLLNISSNFQGNISQNNHASLTSSTLGVSNRIVCEERKEIYQPESLQQIAAKSWKPFDSKFNTSHPFVTCEEKGEIQPFKTDFSCFFPEYANSTEIIAEVQHDITTEGKESVRESSVTMRGNDVLSSKDSTFGQKKNITSNLCSVINETKLNSKDSDLEINKTTKEHCPTVDTILGLFNIDNNLSKSIFQAILSKSFTNGASYTKIVKYLRNKRIFSANLTKCIKNFLKTAVKANLLRMKRNRYFLVSRVGAGAGQFIETDGDERNRKSKNGLGKRQVFSLKSKSKLPAAEEFSEVTSSNSNLEEITNEGKTSKITEEHRPSIDKMFDLFNSDNILSKNILLAVLSENFTDGVTYTEIIKYLRNKHIFSTKLSECIKRFLQTAVNANILRMKRKRYFFVSRDVSQFFRMNSDEWYRNSKI